MPYSPSFLLASFDSLDAPTRCRLVLGLVRALVDVNTYYLGRTPGVPLLYQSGVVYRRQQTRAGESTGVDEWWDIPTCLAMGEGSCEDLAAWRVAELRVRLGYRAARPFVHSLDRADGMALYHVVVRVGTKEEDPSALLGMNSDTFGGF